MQRRYAAVGVVAIIAAMTLLTAGAAAGRARLERIGAGSPPAGLLYLPEGPHLRALALGHEETLADLLYLWAIQYYSTYDDATRYDYLDQVFRGAITELDPHYAEPYLVGAMIMSVEARRPDSARRLYDKGLENMPNNWELAYWAGWDSYFAKDYGTARSYWLRATQMEGSPTWFGRLAARMLEKSGDVDSALVEYRRLARESEDETTIAFAKRWIERAETEIVMRTVSEAIEVYRSRFGRCPERLEQLVTANVLNRLPEKNGQASVHYDAPNCLVLPAPGGTIESSR